MNLQEQFEEWALSKNWCVEKTNDVYNNTIVGCAFEAWVGSRESAVVELPDWFVFGLHAAVYRDDVIDALEQAGVQYK
jgi:hypothetical protein